MLTGCRLGEIMTLKWDYVDLKARELRLPDSKTGAKVVHFGTAAAAVLKGIEKLEENPYVITGRKPESPLTDLQHPWRRIREKAGLGDLRIHDLRHTYASGALALGEGLPMIGKLLGHTQVQTTARYAHLASDPVKSAASRVSDTIGVALAGKARKRNRTRRAKKREQDMAWSGNATHHPGTPLLAPEATAPLSPEQPLHDGTQLADHAIQ
jgi:integrase